MIEIARIPDERIAVLIGKNGSVKKSIERATGTQIEITDIVRIEGGDPIRTLKARDMVLAIGRGFPPGTAKRIADEDCEFHVISLQGETQKTRQRLLGRVIGNNGRAKKRIENETGASICIKGKTVSLIGTPEELEPAEDALRELLAGKTHAHAYSVMNRRKERLL
jgi:ribosomal RNA assembly protein